MPLYTADALVLRTYKLAEADRIVVFLTADRGKKRGVARGARRTRSAFGGALEPLTHVRLAYFEKERRELVGLNFAEPLRSPLAARGDGVGYASYFAELIDEWAPPDDPNERLYRLGASVVDALVRGAAPEPLARYFEYWLLRLQGVYPPHVACQACGLAFEAGGLRAWLAPADGQLTCGECATSFGGARGASLSPEALVFLSAARRLAPGDEGLAGTSAPVLAELEAVHRALITRHLEREPRSARVLRELRRPARAAE